MQCEPILCEPFNGDPFAASVNLTATSGFETRVRVTCQEGHRAVVLGFDAPVSCRLPSEYIISCGMCGWIRSMECRPIACELPQGPYIYGGVSRGTSTITLGINVTVECSRGYMLTGMDHNFTTQPLIPKVALNAKATNTRRYAQPIASWSRSVRNGV